MSIHRNYGNILNNNNIILIVHWCTYPLIKFIINTKWKAFNDVIAIIIILMKYANVLLAWYNLE